MQLVSTSIPGCYRIITRVLQDERGSFVKTFRQDLFTEMGLESHFPEEFFSISQRGVLRGLHFQVPPQEHTKIVHCAYGEILDVVVDLRVGSPTFGAHELFHLHPDLGAMLYLPPGLAHGFYVISPEAVVFYQTSTIHSREHDQGILWNSAGISWPNNSPTLSVRDQTFPRLKDYLSPFIYQPVRMR